MRESSTTRLESRASIFSKCDASCVAKMQALALGLAAQPSAYRRPRARVRGGNGGSTTFLQRSCAGLRRVSQPSCARSRRGRAHARAALAQRRRSAQFSGTIAREFERAPEARCTACDTAFLGAGGLARHLRFCAAQTERKRQRREARADGSCLGLVRARDALLLAEREQRRADLPTVRVTVQTNRAHGLTFADGGLEVKEIASDGTVSATMRVGEGFTLRRLRPSGAAETSWIPVDDSAAFARAFAGIRGGCEIEFARKAKPVTLRGAARRALRTRTATRFTEEQLTFLMECFNSATRVRDKEAWRRMQADVRFKNQLNENGRSLVLTQAQIAGFFSRKCGEQKKAARANALAAAAALALEAADDADDEDGDPDGDDE